MAAILATILVMSIGGLVALLLWKIPKDRPVETSNQQMLFQGTALRWLDEQMDHLNRKASDRSLEIAEADGRFLVTPEDMKRAYEEVIREEHM